MKEHAKKALKHDFKVAGKTVPTLALVALFLVGTGSAALLSSFGTVSGTADVNQSVVVDSTGESFSLVAGETVHRIDEVTNNLNRSVGVTLNPTVENEPSTEMSTTSGDALTLDTMLLKDGMAVDRVRENTETESSEAEASYVLRSGSAAVRAHVDANDAHASAGVWFNVSDASLTSGETTVEVEATEGPDHEGSQVPDWVVLGVEDSDGNQYLVYSATVDTTGSQLTWDGSTFEGNDAVTYKVTNSLNSDFGEIEKESSSVDPEGMDIEFAGTMTGTTGDGVYDIYYEGFQFNGEDYLQSGSNTEILPGNSDVVTIAESDVAAVPGTYEVDTDVSPQ